MLYKPSILLEQRSHHYTLPQRVLELRPLPQQDALRRHELRQCSGGGSESAAGKHQANCRSRATNQLISDLCNRVNVDAFVCILRLNEAPQTAVAHRVHRTVDFLDCRAKLLNLIRPSNFSASHFECPEDQILKSFALVIPARHRSSAKLLIERNESRPILDCGDSMLVFLLCGYLTECIVNMRLLRSTHSPTTFFRRRM